MRIIREPNHRYIVSAYRSDRTGYRDIGFFRDIENARDFAESLPYWRYPVYISNLSGDTIDKYKYPAK